MNDGATGSKTSELPPLLARLVSTAPAAVLTDFDGTLAPIVDDPTAARPLPGATAVLAQLADVFATVAVISGRPAAFLAEQLAAAGPKVALYGVYGYERVEGGEVRVAAAAGPWLERVAATVAAAAAEAPPGAGVEDKRVTMTLHWRNAPAAEAWAREFAAAWARRSGLVVQPGRLSLELRPPLAVDKGAVVEELAAPCAAACFLGDDTGDLPAFAALERLGRRGLVTARVAVADRESPPELIAAADVVVDSPGEALDLLERLARAAGRPPGGDGAGRRPR